LGFKGCLLNPDPYENSGTEAPAMGDRYWYPLYEKLCELDVPAHIHSAGSRSQKTPYTLNFLLDETVAVYGLIHSDVFKDFPTLKIVCSHGGGAIPFHVGRFHASALRRGGDFYAEMRNIYYDTVLYSEEALRLLIKTVGADNCLFGAECPGVGSAVDPHTGRTLDDIAPFILGFDWLSQEDKDKIMFGNATRLFKLDPPAA
jgi:4-oxalmesaconate hydratase